MFLLLNDYTSLLYAIKFLLDFDTESFSLIQSYLISPLQSWNYLFGVVIMSEVKKWFMIE